MAFVVAHKPLVKSARKGENRRVGDDLKKKFREKPFKMKARYRLPSFDSKK